MKNESLLIKIYETLYNQLDVGIHIINNKGKTIVYNKKMMEIDSMLNKDVLGKNLLDVFKFKEKEDSTLVKALKTGKVIKRVRQTYFNNKGKKIVTINNSFPVKHSNKIIAAIEISKDLTRSKSTPLHKGGAKFTFNQIISESTEMEKVIKKAKRAAKTSSSILIIGDTGTGKELFAQSIHNESPRKNGPFISQNCAAIPGELMESLLFGTKKGAFTGAVDRPGLFEQANGGTLLLDEINSLDPILQSKLLRVIQEKSITRVGDLTDKKVDVRIISTINEDPLNAIHQNRLRSDLYYRLSVVPLFIPKLSKRKKDISILTKYFIEKYNNLFQMNVRGVCRETEEAFKSYDWPGNVRELEHNIEGAMNIMTENDVIDIRNLPSLHFKNEYLEAYDSMEENIKNGTEMTLQDRIKKKERTYIKEAIQRNNNNITHAAKELGISRQSLQYHIKKLRI